MFQHLPSDLRQEGGLTVKFICKAQEEFWTQKKHISLWGQSQKGCDCAFGAGLFQHKVYPRHWEQSGLSCFPGWREAVTVRAKIRSKNSKMGTALQLFGEVTLLKNTKKEWKQSPGSGKGWHGKH